MAATPETVTTLPTVAKPIEERKSLVTRFADRFGVDPAKLLHTLKLTAFRVKGEPISNEQMMALLVVADQYGLNPFTKEIYAYPDKQNGIVPVVGVDGWSRIINQEHALDGIEFRYSETTVQHKGKTCHEWMECSIYRKDRERPITVRERFEEVVRNASFPTPWDTHPNRMHRHKTLIQCARYAFGFAGIYDDDEAARISGTTEVATQRWPTASVAGNAETVDIDAELTGEAPNGPDVDPETGEVVPENL